MDQSHYSIENWKGSTQTMNTAQAFLDESRVRAQGGFARIHHCLDQLGEDDIWWQPAEGLNSAGNLILHVCGNLRQWIGHGIGELSDVRNRDAEFDASTCADKAALQALLCETAAIVDESLSNFEPTKLLTGREIQNSEQTALAAIYRVIGHLDGHGMQIVYITRMRRGVEYVSFTLKR